MYNGDLSRRVTRWEMLIEEFDYEIRYVQGQRNLETDLLSRNLAINVINLNSMHERKKRKLMANSKHNPPTTTQQDAEIKPVYTTL